MIKGNEVPVAVVVATLALVDVVVIANLIGLPLVLMLALVLAHGWVRDKATLALVLVQLALVLVLALVLAHGWVRGMATLALVLLSSRARVRGKASEEQRGRKPLLSIVLVPEHGCY